MKRHIAFLTAVGAMLGAAADTIPVEQLNFAGPFTVPAPYFVDSLDVNGKAYATNSVLELPMNLEAVLKSAAPVTALPAVDGDAVGVLGFTMTNMSYATPQILVEGAENYSLIVDGRKTGSSLTLLPGTHQVAVKYMMKPGQTVPTVKIVSDNPSVFDINRSGKMYTLDNVLHGRRIYGSWVSPDGKYLITAYRNDLKGGKSSYEYVLTDISGRHIATTGDYIAWMPRGSRYYRVVSTAEGRNIETTDAATGAKSVFAEKVPDGNFSIAPNEKFLIYTRVSKGPKEDPAVYRILEPEDRQPGWRNRSSVEIYDVATGVTRPVTFGSHNASMLDISEDGSKMIISSSRSRLERRPTTLNTIAVVDLATMKADTIVAGDGFVAGAVFSPDASKIVISGSPEALGGIGKNVPEGRIPSMYDYQLYLYDIASRKVTPLTRDFNPSVGNYTWSRADGKLYFTADDRDCVSFFVYDPKTSRIGRINIPQDIVKSFSLPDKGTVIALTTQSAANPDRLYTYDTKTGRINLLDEPLGEALRGVDLAAVEAWDFVNSRGDTICGRFYLPPNFDPAKKYPMIVNYYGGCSPVERTFESRYPHHAYAALGYVVYVIEPSGATGFGQEFSSRHVNTAGDGPAQDIIEGTKQFCNEHPYVDATKIGCIGASYGGFMTQYLQTVTDIFAAAISHAGISDHTSYWGEGYWGYSYSEVSMANSYPWSDRELYVNQSPLYNADKIHTPLLFLHGDADHNVPVGESIQMFTALKLLGRPTAFVAVADQDHHIMDYDKRIKWQNTIFAWFAKYLKGEPEWWDAMYPPTTL